MANLIYKISPADEWRKAEESGIYEGAAIDLADGYLHFSTAAQVRETAAKHFAGKDDLVLVAVDETRLGSALRYEISRGGQPFPHLYAPLSLEAVVWVKDLPLGPEGDHLFPPLGA